MKSGNEILMECAEVIDHEQNSGARKIKEWLHKSKRTDRHRARKIRAQSRILRLEREVLRPENFVQSQLCA